MGAVVDEPFRVTWFAPDRPVEGGTVYVRPEVDDTDMTPAEFRTRQAEGEPAILVGGPAKTPEPFDAWAAIQDAIAMVERQAREPQRAPRIFLPGGGELIATDLPFLYVPEEFPPVPEEWFA